MVMLVAKEGNNLFAMCLKYKGTAFVPFECVNFSKLQVLKKKQGLNQRVYQCLPFNYLQKESHLCIVSSWLFNAHGAVFYSTLIFLVR